MTLGERVLVKTHRRIRPWFFEQDGGWYVQCRYGARVITADGTNNAVFVKSLADVLGVLDALLNAAAAGELDTCHYPSGRAQTRSQTRRCQSCSTCLTLTQLK